MPVTSLAYEAASFHGPFFTPPHISPRIFKPPIFRQTVISYSANEVVSYILNTLPNVTDKITPTDGLKTPLVAGKLIFGQNDGSLYRPSPCMPACSYDDYDDRIR